MNDEDYEAEAYGVRPTVRGTFARMRSGLGNIVTTLRGLPTPLNLALKAVENINNPYTNVLGNLNRATRTAIARESVRDLQGRIDKGEFGSVTPTPQDAARVGGGGGGGSSGHAGGAAAAAGAAAQAADDEAAGAGGYNKGGLATMFTRRR